MKHWALACAALALAGSAAAQPGGEGAKGGGALRGACRADIEQLCAGVQRGGGKIMQCLREHQDGVSADCKAAMSDARASHRGRQGPPPETPAPPAPAPG
jgi:Cysteine rich repeat